MLKTIEPVVIDRLLDLPQPKESNVVEKRFVGEVDLSDLNDEQLQSFKDIDENCLRGEYPMWTLKGFAGSGKTYVTTKLIEYVLGGMFPYNTVGIAAPTNKAVKVIHDQCPVKDTRLVFDTVHAFLGLKEHIDGYGNQTFIQKNGGDAKLTDVGLLLVDEGGMLPEDLFELLNNYTTNGYGDMKIIFIGDPAQIPPVGKEDSIPFLTDEQKKYNIGESFLSKIVRQAEGNPLIKLSMEIRESLHRPIAVPLKEDRYDPITMDGVFFLNSNRAGDFHLLLDTYFNSENYKLNSDFVKIIAWRNKTIKLFNSLVRKKIYGVNIPKLCIGERLIANSPIIEKGGDMGRDKILFTTNDEFTVLSYTIETNAGNLKYYVALVRDNTKIAGTEKTIRILHEDSEELFQEYLDMLKSQALAERKGSWQAAEKWQDWYAFKAEFADVNYSYAITAHKSQGSTYDNVFVLESDIDANRNVVERNRIKYTAFTRPRHKLFVCE